MGIMWGANQIIKFILFFLLLACSSSAFGQRKNAPLASMAPASGGSASGTLTVTATVVTSVGVIIDQDGQQRIVIANAPDSADNVSRFVMLTDQNGSQVNSYPKKSKEKRH
jgi:hypothetical protein